MMGSATGDTVERLLLHPYKVVWCLAWCYYLTTVPYGMVLYYLTISLRCLAWCSTILLSHYGAWHGAHLVLDALDGGQSCGYESTQGVASCEGDAHPHHHLGTGKVAPGKMRYYQPPRYVSTRTS